MKKKLTSKYDGQICPICGFEIARGDQIYWSPAEKASRPRVVHVICEDVGPPEISEDDYGMEKWMFDLD